MMTRLEFMYKTVKPRKNATGAINKTITKRKRVVLNFVQRQEIVSKLKSGYSTEKLSMNYGVASRTIYEIRKTGDGVLEKFRAENPNNEMRSTFKMSQYPLVDTALKMWFYQARAVSMIISQELVAIQAKLFYDELYSFDIPGRKIKFNASLGFVQRFRINVNEASVIEVIDFPCQTLFPNDEMTAWLSSDKDDPGWATLSNNEIVSEVLHVGVYTVDLAEPEIEEQLQEDTVSTNEALEAVIKLNKWLGLHKCSAEQPTTTFQLEQFIRDKQSIPNDQQLVIF